MEPETTNTEPATGKKKLRLFVIVGMVFFILALGIFYVVVIRGGGSVGEGIRSILPFGEATDTGIPVGGLGNGGKLDDVGLGGGSGDLLPRMWKIADGPVSGSVWKTLPDGSLAVRYVLREDGDIYEYGLRDRSERILSNNSIPRVAEAIWDARGQSVVLRTATDQGDIISILGKLLPNPAAGSGDEAPAVLQRSVLRDNISFVVPGPTDGFAHTQRTGNDLSIILLDTLGQATSVFTSPFTEWIPEWASPNSMTLSTRPSGAVGGYLFTLDPKTGATTPIISDFPGLTVKGAPDGNHILVGGSDRNALTFGIITKEYPVLSDIVPATLPEKCAWTASSTLAYCGVPQNPSPALYPDEWYQGLVQFSDTLWTYETGSGQFTLTLVPVDAAGVEVDIVSPLVSPDGGYLVFTNKKDGSLWGITLLGGSQ